jgi:hypothetical protein
VALTEDQEFEKGWWGTCLNTFSEETKQLTYSHRMGLHNTPDDYTGRWPQYDMQGKSVLDIGGGPASILLKCVNLGPSAVVDPCPYPEWVGRRYAAAGITYFQEPGETFDSPQTFDECWIYNVLQHVENPEDVIKTARRHATWLRIFEWIMTPPTLGHPHMLTPDLLDKWIGAPEEGTDGSAVVTVVNENTAVGKAYYGWFAL